MLFLTSGKTAWQSTKARGVTEEMFISVTTSQLMNWLQRWRRPLGKADRQFKIKWQSKSLTTPLYVQKWPANNKEIPKLRITILLWLNFTSFEEPAWINVRKHKLLMYCINVLICISELSLILKRHSFLGFTAKENKNILSSDFQYHCYWWHPDARGPITTIDFAHYRVWDAITYPFPNFNCNVEVWEWISNFIPHFTGHVISLPCRD